MLIRLLEALVHREIPPFLEEVKAVFRTKLIGGRAPGRVHRPARTDAVDCANCLSFVNSSLSPVVLFRRRLSSVGDVLKVISKNGFFDCKMAGPYA